MVKTIDTPLGQLNITQDTIHPGVVTIRADLDSPTTEPIGFIQTRTLEYTDRLDGDYDVHRTGIWHQAGFPDSVPFYCLGYPAQLYIRLEAESEPYAKWRVTIRTFLVALGDGSAKPEVRFLTGFAWGYECQPDWQPMAVTPLKADDWSAATARLFYESPAFDYQTT